MKTYLHMVLRYMLENQLHILHKPFHHIELQLLLFEFSFDTLLHIFDCMGSMPKMSSMSSLLEVNHKDYIS